MATTLTVPVSPYIYADGSIASLASLDVKDAIRERAAPTAGRARVAVIGGDALLDQGVGHTRQHARPDRANCFTPRCAVVRSRVGSAQARTRASSRTSPSDNTPPSSCQLFASHRAQRWKTTSRPAIRMRIVISAPFAQRVQACIGGLPAKIISRVVGTPGGELKHSAKRFFAARSGYLGRSRATCAGRRPW